MGVPLSRIRTKRRSLNNKSSNTSNSHDVIQDPQPKANKSTGAHQLSDLIAGLQNTQTSNNTRTKSSADSVAAISSTQSTANALVKSCQLSNLVAELREEIYGYIFNIHTNQHECETWHNFLGCRCGEGLSLSNSFFYLETRARYARCANFVIQGPKSRTNFFKLKRSSHSRSAVRLSAAYQGIQLAPLSPQPTLDVIASNSTLRGLQMRMKSPDAFMIKIRLHRIRPDIVCANWIDPTILRVFGYEDLIDHREWNIWATIPRSLPEELRATILLMSPRILSQASEEGQRLLVQTRWQRHGRWHYDLEIVDREPT